MGGHGGLNILPQKRWNVYNQDNRLKVAQDEEKAKKAEDEAKAKQQRADTEFKRMLLLKRVTGTSEVITSETDPNTTIKHQHINFWAEDEAKLEHPDVKLERKNEKRKRGKEDFYTSDPKFDEKFQLGYGMGDKPWYAVAQTTRQESHGLTSTTSLGFSRITAGSEAGSIAIGTGHAPQLQIKSKGTPRQGVTDSSESDGGSDSSSSTNSSDDSSEGSSSSGTKKKRKHSRKHKHKRHKHKRRKRDKPNPFGFGVKSVEELRMERLAREKMEMERSRKLMLGVVQRLDDAQGKSTYNSAFGHAAALRRKD